MTEEDTPKECINPYGGLRYCGACDALVEDSAVCSACGVEEDPGLWRMGPPQVLFTASFAVSVHFDSNRVSALGAEPLHVVETAIRLYFEGRLERWEASLGVRLRVARMGT